MQAVAKMGSLVGAFVVCDTVVVACPPHDSIKSESKQVFDIISNFNSPGHICMFAAPFEHVQNTDEHLFDSDA